MFNGWMACEKHYLNLNTVRRGIPRPDDVIEQRTAASRLRVNLRRERFVRTGPLNPNLPPPQTHPQAAAVRHKP